MQQEIIWYCNADIPLSFAAMRSAVAAFLFARSHGMSLTVRIKSEDTSVKLACLRRELHFLGIVPDEISAVSALEWEGCCAAAAHFITGDRAYCGKQLSRRKVLFRLPENPQLGSVLFNAGPKSMMLHAGMVVDISRRGIFWRSPGGTRCCSPVAMPDLVLRRTDGKELFRSSEQREQVMKFGKRFRIAGAAHAEFTGRDVGFSDVYSGKCLFPLEQLADPVLVDGNGHPTLLLTEVLGTIERGGAVLTDCTLSPMRAAEMTLLFDAFGYPPPAFLLQVPAEKEELPDYTELKRLGIVPEVLFHELARSFAGKRESCQVRSCREWIRLMHHHAGEYGFHHSDLALLRQLNRNFLQSLPDEEFCRRSRAYAPKVLAKSPIFPMIAATKHKSAEVLSDAAAWKEDEI